MLLITAVVALLGARVVSTTPVHVIRSAHKLTSWNVTNTPISVSSPTRMNSSSYIVNSEERAQVPSEIDSILNTIHAKDLLKTQKDSEVAKITNRIKVMNRKYHELTKGNERQKPPEASFFSSWTEYVKKKYWKTPETGIKVMFATLASHFHGDDFPSVLVAATKVDDVEDIALQLLDLQLVEWEELKRDPADVFKLLKLDETQGNLIKDKLFLKWVKFVESKHAESPMKAYDYMFRFLTEYFKEEYALIDALIDGAQAQHSKSSASKSIASTLLKFQVTQWAKDGRDMTEIFKGLKLQQPNDNLFESPRFILWFDFLTKIKDKRRRYQKVLNILNTQYQGDNLTSLLVKKGQSKYYSFAKSLLKIQAEKWASDKTISVEYVFDTLQLNKKDSNPFESLLFSVWAHFVERRYSVQQNKAKEVMLETLSSYFNKSDLVSALKKAKETQTKGTKRVADELLEYKNLEEVTKNVNAAYPRVKFRETMDNYFNTPTFSDWVALAKSEFSNDQKATESILSIVGHEFTEELKKFLAEKMEVVEKRPQPKRRKRFDLNKPLPKSS